MIGINIDENNKIYLGSKIEDAIEMMETRGVKYYVILNDKSSGNALVSILNSKMEIEANKGIINYIKCGSTKITQICDSNEKMEFFELLMKLKKGVVQKLGINESKIELDTADVESGNFSFIIVDKKVRARVHILNYQKEVYYINTIKIFK